MPNILEVIKSNPSLSILNEILNVAGIEKELSTGKDLTLFAPTNEGITKQLEMLGISKDDFLNDTENIKRLAQYHLVGDKVVYSKDVKEDMLLNSSFEGNTIDLSKENDRMTINGSLIVMPDQVADNGVVHIIERPLTPPVQA